MPAAVRVSVSSSNQITCTPDTLSMRSQGKNVVITWTCITPGWNFTSDGITLKAPSSQFSAPGANGQTFRMTDANTDYALYSYNVKLTNGTQVISVDPFIQNGDDPPPMIAAVPPKAAAPLGASRQPPAKKAVKKAAKKAVRPAAKKSAKRSAAKAGSKAPKKTPKKTPKKAAKQAARKPAKKPARGAAPKPAKKAAKKPAGQTARKPVRKAAKKPARK